MDARVLLQLMEQVKRGEVAPEVAARRIAELPLQQVSDFAQLDGEREVGAYDSIADVVGAALLVDALGPDRIVSLPPPASGAAPREGLVAVVCAGTTDIPVAEEACATALIVGAQVERIYDVGISGIHRLLRKAKALREADALVVCAGMEGALPSVVGGLVPRPVIAVPTSVGYGASLGGLAALLAMLNSCAANVSVVNIDNGFGAGFQAALIARQSHLARAGREAQPE